MVVPEARSSRTSLPGAVPGRGVKAGGRLVEEQQTGVADHTQSQVEPALLPTGEVFYLPLLVSGQADQLDGLVDTARGRVVAGVAGHGFANG